MSGVSLMDVADGKCANWKVWGSTPTTRCSVSSTVIADSATELYVSSCVLSRLNHLLMDPAASDRERRDGLLAGRYYLKTAGRRIRQNLAGLWDNDDDATNALANRLLGR